MDIQNSLDNLKKTKEWKLISEAENSDLIILHKKSSKQFEIFMGMLYKKFGVNSYDKKLIQKTILLSRFPEVFMSTNLSEYETNIYNRSKEIFKMLIIKDTINLKILFQKLLTFGIMYKDWEDKDKAMQIEILCEIFNSYNKFINEVKHKDNLSPDDKSTYIKCINTFLNKILHTLRLLDSNWKDILLNYKYKSLDYDKTSHNNMVKYFKSIFWENLYLEIAVKKNYNICNYLVND